MVSVSGDVGVFGERSRGKMSRERRGKREKKGSGWDETLYPKISLILIEYQFPGTNGSNF